MKHAGWKLFCIVVGIIMLGCSIQHADRVMRPHASGTPLEGDGGGDGGGTPATTISVGPGGTITGSSTLTVPITIANASANGNKGFQVTLRLSAGLRLTPNVGSGAQPGSYLTGCGSDPSPIFWAGYNVDSSITVIAALNPNHCATCSSGTVFNLVLEAKAQHSATEHVYLVASPQGALTPSPTVKDCSNADVSVIYGLAAAAITVQ